MTAHHVVEAARVDLPGTQSVAEFVQVDTNLGIVACTSDVRAFDEGIGTVQWTLTPVDVTAGTASAGASWTPTAAPYALTSQQLVALSGGKAIYLREWSDGSGGGSGNGSGFTEMFVLVTDGSVITVDSTANLHTDLGIAGHGLARKTAALAALISVADGTNPTVFYRADVGVGSVSLSPAVGPAGELFGADDYTVNLFFDHADAIDGTGAIITTVSYTPVTGYYLPLTATTAALVGTSSYVSLTLHPLAVDAAGAIAGTSPIAGSDPNLLGQQPDFVFIPGAPAGEAEFFYLAAVGVNAADVYTFGQSPAVGWDHDSSTPMAYIDGVDNGGHATNRRFWPHGVGDQTVVVAWNAGSVSPTVAVLAVTTVPPPIARLTVTPPVGTSPDIVVLDATASSTTLPFPLTYGWAFGDGATAAGLAIRTHTYTTAVPHVFSATVTVTDAFGQQDSVSEPVRVGPAVAPPQRVFPRDDGLGMSTRRSFPPPTSDQYGIRRAPGEWYR